MRERSPSAAGGAEGYYVNGRGDWTRTSDPLTPSQVRYRAALRPDLPKRPVPVSILEFPAQGKNHAGGIKRNESRG